MINVDIPRLFRFLKEKWFWLNEIIIIEETNTRQKRYKYYLSNLKKINAVITWQKISFFLLLMVFLIGIFLFFSGGFLNFVRWSNNFTIINSQNNQNIIDRANSEMFNMRANKKISDFSTFEIQPYDKNNRFFKYIFLKENIKNKDLIVRMPVFDKIQKSTITEYQTIIISGSDCPKFRNLIEQKYQSIAEIAPIENIIEANRTQCTPILKYITESNSTQEKYAVFFGYKVLSNPIPSVYAYVVITSNENNAQYIKDELEETLENIFKNIT